MKWLVLPVLALAMLSTPARAESELAPLAFLHGCWVGSFDSPDGLTDQRCFEPIMGGRFLRDTHSVVGAGYGGETIYAWNAERRRIEATYYASDGGLMTGVVADEGESGLWLREGRYVGANGALQHLRSRWIRDGNDSFTIETQREENGEWRQMSRIIYRRAPAE